MFSHRQAVCASLAQHVVLSTFHAGASLTASYSGTIEQESVSTDSQTYQVTVKGGLTGSAADDLTYTVMLAYFGNNLDSAVASGTPYPLIGGLPADGCSAFRFPNSMPGKVVLLQRGNCTFQTKVLSCCLCALSCGMCLVLFLSMC